MPERPGREERKYLWLIGVVAVLLLVVGVTIGLLVGDDGTVEVPLEATELAPGAVASAQVDETAQGLRIVLDVSGLAPAPPGSYYQVWVRSDGDGVSAGTFHLRGGDGSLELLAGVSSADDPQITITLHDEGVGPETSGRIVLRGEPGP